MNSSFPNVHRIFSLFVAVAAMVATGSHHHAAAQTRVDSELIVRSIIARSGRNNAALGESIAALARINRPAEANRLIQKIDLNQLGAEQTAAIYRAIGPAAQIRLLGSDEIDATSRKILQTLAQADQTIRTDPAQLQNAAAVLLSTDANERQRAAATRQLSQGGLPALKTIIEQLVRSPPETTSPVSPSIETNQLTTAQRDLLRTALQIDPRVGDALVPWIVYGSEPQVKKATKLLENLTRDANAIALAIGQIQTRGGLSDVQDAASLTEAFDIVRQSSVRMPRDGQLDEVWLFDPLADGGTLSWVQTGLIEANYRRDADLAAGLRRILPPAHAGYVNAVVADLSYRVLIDPDWGDDAQIVNIQSDIAPLGDGSFLSRVYASAKAKQDLPAVLACVRLAIDALESEDGQNRSEYQGLLVDSLNSSIMQARFEAAIALKRAAADGTRFAGQSVVDSVLAEASRLDSRPSIVLVETRPEIIGGLEQRIGQTTYQLEVVSSVAALMRRLARGGDIRLILSKRQLADMAPIELVDRVSRLPRLDRLPIAFFRNPPIADDVGIYASTPDEPLSPDTLARRFDRIGGDVVEIDYPRTPESIDRFIRESAVVDRLPALNELDRRLYAQTAIQLVR